MGQHEGPCSSFPSPSPARGPQRGRRDREPPPQCSGSRRSPCWLVLRGLDSPPDPWPVIPWRRGSRSTPTTASVRHIATSPPAAGGTTCSTGGLALIAVTSGPL